MNRVNRGGRLSRLPRWEDNEHRDSPYAHDRVPGLHSAMSSPLKASRGAGTAHPRPARGRAQS